MFKFDEYPEIKECHKRYSQIMKELSEADIKDEECEDDRYLKIFYAVSKKEDYFRYNIYAKAVFDTFNPIKPMLRDILEDYKESAWNEVFGNDFEKFTESQRSRLVGLVEDECPYILPQEYYIGKNKFEKGLEMADMD